MSEWPDRPRHRWYTDGLVWTVIGAVAFGGILAMAISQLIGELS